jgi:hypothetical protein
MFGSSLHILGDLLKSGKGQSVSTNQELKVDSLNQDASAPSSIERVRLDTVSASMRLKPSPNNGETQNERGMGGALFPF